MQNSTTTIPHKPVLYRETIDAFKDIDSGYIIDCTMGYAGHSSMILESNPNITLIGIDQDQTAIDFSTQRLEPFKDRVIIKKGRFSEVIKEILKEIDISEIRGVLADIGVSSLQLDQMDRGFSFSSDVLDMRMDKNAPLSAMNVVNEYSVNEIAHILKEYGELSNAKKVAQRIVAERPFSSAKALSDALQPVLYQGKKIHPSTLVMQAIRIEVNDELGELKRLLHEIYEAGLEEARIGIISFHSLEDRIVKQEFVRWAKKCSCDPHAMRCMCSRDNDIGKIISKKPIMAQKDELKENARSRSAKLHLFDIIS